ncbi:MAG: hypothetical protein WA144_11735, partial [Candidatus Methanoperedens sp.]
SLRCLYNFYDNCLHMIPFISYSGLPSFLLALLFICKFEFEHNFVYGVERYSYFASSKYRFFLIQCILPEPSWCDAQILGCQ